MPKLLNVGIIGCGEAVQILHLPTLRELPSLFRVTAVCDASQTVVDGVGETLLDATRYTTADALLSDPRVDVVLIANPNVFHAPMAIAALAAAKHVLIEKPMCMTLAEADALDAAQKAANRVVQIGYMRRHAPAFEEAVALVSAMRGTINHARVRDIIGPNASFVDPTSNVVRGADISAAATEMTIAETNKRLIEAIGTDKIPQARAYSILLGLSSHDISAMRELLGMPLSVLHATMRRDGLFLTAVFDYGDFVCQFETGIDKIARFDASLEVFGQNQIVKVEYDTPYIRHQPAVLTVTQGKTAHGVSVCRSHPTRGDAFVVEWQRLHASITNDAPNKADIADARQDLEIFAQIMAHL